MAWACHDYMAMITGNDRLTCSVGVSAGLSAGVSYPAIGGPNHTLAAIMKYNPINAAPST
jgi:hypothetical protein